MKHDVLRSIAHNIAASLASGFLVGGYVGTDIFGEALRTAEGFIAVDFLNGAASPDALSTGLLRVVAECPQALSRLCAKHGISAAVLTELTARYRGGRFRNLITVTVADCTGRRTVTEYGGLQCRRVKILDGEGRLRPKPIRRG